MNKYEMLLKQIKEHIIKENDNINSDVVSAYELVKLVYEETAPFRNITKNSTLSKRLKIASKFTPFIPEYTLSISKSKYDDYKTILKFLGKESYGYFHVLKNEDTDDLYFVAEYDERNNKFLQTFVKKNYDLILEAFHITEEYVDILGSIGIFSSTLENDLFEVNVNIYTNGETNVVLGINKNNPLHKESLKNYVRKENIENFLTEYKLEILKNLFVDIDKIPEPINKIYNKHTEKNKTLKKM